MAKNRSFGKAAKSSRPSGKAANALGYAKRQTLKSKTLSPGDIGDVYEYQQEKVRRAKVKLQLEKDELLGAGGAESGSDDEEDRGSRRKRDMKPRLVGENDDDDGIAEDEDEEIDSDEAFEESDEERFAGFSFSHKKKAKSKAKPKKKASAVRFAEVDLNEDSDGANSEVDEEEASEGSDDEDEDDEDEEEGDPEDFLDVLDVLDGRANLEGEEVNLEAGKDRTSSQQREAAQAEEKEDEDEEMDSEEDKDDDDEDEDEEDEDDQMLSPSEDEGDESALQELESFVTGLDAGQKRKAPDDEDTKDAADAKRARKRRLLPDRTEAGAENEFIAASGAGKVNLDDLLAPLEAQSSNLQSLKKSAKVLASSSGKVKTLSAPLPQRTAEKLDREAAYEQTKEEVDKWKATMQRIKEAEHLSFPLQAEPKSRTSNLELAAKFKPVTELESAVDKLLKSAKMRENEIAQTESLKMNHLSVEEVAARRAELAKMRDLMFRAEAKAKRIAKIKSKTYRRLKKKERARLAEKLGENEDDLDDEEAQLKREVERARERATLRHKNTGKWAKSMRARGELDEDQRRDINEMLDRGEKLRRKIRGEGESGDEDDSDDESDMEDDEEGIARIKSKAFDELAALQANEPEAPEGKKGKSIFEMKFMKDAMAREQRKAHEMVDDFMKEMGGVDPDDDAEGEEGDHHEGDGPSGAVIQRTGGRAVYRPGALNTNVRPTGSLASDTSSVTLKSTDFPPETRDTPVEQSASPPGSPISQRPVPPPTEAVNPWLAQASESSTAAQKKHEVAISKTSAAAEKSKNKLRKRVQKRLDEKEKAQDEATVDISLSTVMTLGEAGPSSKAGQSSAASTAKPSSAAAKGKARASQDDDESDSDANSEVEEQEKALAQKGKGKGKGKANAVKAFEQRDLVALAFAGDNVVQDFAEAKQREIQADAPKKVDTTLPGWGSWGGIGTKKAPPKPHLIKKVAGVDPTTRADYKKAHVIISEKRDKKAAKYQVKDLPFPYTSKAQFERSMEMPLGTEWNTRLGFQRATLPKVVTKMGTLITPLEKQT